MVKNLILGLIQAPCLAVARANSGQSLSSIQATNFFFQKSGSVTLTKNFVQKLYIMYTNIIQNTKFVYILYTMIVQIKTLYDECTKKLHYISTYIQIMYKMSKTCTKFRPKMA